MEILNIEIKARTKQPAKIRNILKTKNAKYKGLDHQIDTYFKVHNGRLKLREGAIENHLIYYARENQKGPKRSEVMLFKTRPGSTLKELLVAANGILTIIDKKREIYFIDNVKFHLDAVKGLGSFVEIEAIDKDGSIGEKKLLQQCEHYLKLFGISESELVATSYSDLKLQKETKPNEGAH